MSELILKEFRCVVDTDEAFADSPYFVVFVGDLQTRQTAVKLVRQGNWHNDVEKGELWVVNVPVVSGFSFNPGSTLILVALIEEDENLDITGLELSSVIKSSLTAKFNSFIASGSTVVTAAIEAAIRSAFNSALTLTLSNDDRLGIRRLKPNGQTGPQPLLHFNHTPQWYYRVRFVIQQ